MIKLYKQKITNLNYILLILLLFITACDPLTHEYAFGKMPEECQKFFELNSNKREEIFETYNLDKQLRLHYCATKWKDTEVYAIPIARRSEDITPFLLNGLRNTTDEWMIYSIIDTFDLMHLKSKLKKNENLMNEINNAISKIKDAHLKKKTFDVISKW